MSPAVQRIVLGGALDPDVRAWRSAIAANGGSVGPAAVREVNRFVRGCKADGVWDALLDVGLFAGVDNLAAALVKLKTPAGVSRTLTNVNFVAVDYTATGASAGLVGNGTTKRLETGVIPSVVTTPSSISMSLYATALPIGGPSTSLIGVADVSLSTAAHCVLMQESATRRGALGHCWTLPVNLQVNAETALASVHNTLSRTSTTDSRIYNNGVQSGVTNTNTATGLAAGSVGLYSLRYGTGGNAYTHNNYSSMSARFYHIGLGLTEAQVAALSTRVNTLMAAFGANVY